MADINKLRRLAQERERAEQQENSNQREQKRRADEIRQSEFTAAKERKCQQIINSVNRVAEFAASLGKREAVVMFIAQGGVENFNRFKKRLLGGTYEDHSVRLSQVTSDVARRVYAHCEKEGLNPFIRWNKNNCNTAYGTPTSTVEGYESSSCEDMFEIVIRW